MIVYLSGIESLNPGNSQLIVEIHQKDPNHRITSIPKRYMEEEKGKEI